MKNSQNGFALLTMLLIAAGVLVAGGAGYWWYQNQNQAPQLIGGQTDEHGCLGPAGYSWCEVKQKCLKIWEEKCEATSTAQTSNSQATDWHIYHNTTYGFTLTFPDAWKGYRVQESTSTISFGIKDQDLIFRIAVMTKQEWDNTQKDAAEFGGPLPSVIDKNSNYVFVSVSSQDFTNAVMDLARMRNSIISTFKFNP